MKFSLIKSIIVLQKGFDPIVANCFHFAFRAVTRKPQQRMEAKRESGFQKSKSFFFFIKKKTLQPKSG